MSGLLQDLRYALRGLRKTPGFTAVAVLTLTLGIGATTAVFSVMNAVMLKTLPVAHPDQLVLLQYQAGRGLPREIRRTSSGYGRTSLSFATFEHLRRHNQTLSSVFALAATGLNNQSLAVSRDGEPSLAAGEMVSGQYFEGLGVTPILGRAIVEEDEKLESPPVAVVSHRYWTSQFGRDAGVIGTTVALNRTPFTIIGVAPPEFFGLNPALASDIWVPLRDGLGIGPWGERPPPGESILADHARWRFMIGGRLKPGVSTEQARADLNVLFQRSITEGVSGRAVLGTLPRLELLAANRGLHVLRQRSSESLWVLMTTVALLLLIACANVATLQVARAVARQREMGIRLATGASRGRLVRQLLTESAVLALIGGGLALLVAHWGSRALLVLMSRAGQSIAVDVRVDSTVLIFSATVCLATSVLFGLAPAVRATRVDVARTLKDTARACSPQRRVGNALVVCQVALSLLLLIGAGLFLRTLENLLGQDIGFERRNLLTFALDAQLGSDERDRITAIYQQVLESLQALSGVRSASASTNPLLSGSRGNDTITADVRGSETMRSVEAYVNRVSPSFFETLRIPLLVGRSVDWGDIRGVRRVAVVNEALARQLFPNDNPLGRRFKFGGANNPVDAHEIVGVVGNAQYASLREAIPPTVYAPYTATSRPLGRLHFQVRTVGDPRAMIPAVREMIHRIDPELPLIGVKTQTDQIAELLTQERMFARLVTVFALLSLLLVSIGLYGTLALGVTRRTNEIGVRMAIGAEGKEVLWMILRECLVLIAAGAAVGLPLAFGTTRFIASQLYGVDPNDILTIGVAVLTIAAIGVLAGLLPARRAARVDPLVALRYE